MALAMVVGEPTEVGVRIHVEAWRDRLTGGLVIAGAEPGLERLLLWVHPDSASALLLLNLLVTHEKVPEGVLVDWEREQARPT
jgi:hypothetical protein